MVLGWSNEICGGIDHYGERRAIVDNAYRSNSVVLARNFASESANINPRRRMFSDNTCTEATQHAWRVVALCVRFATRWVSSLRTGGTLGAETASSETLRGQSRSDAVYPDCSGSREVLCSQPCQGYQLNRLMFLS